MLFRSTNIIAQAGLNLNMDFLTKGLSLKGLMAYQTNSVNGLYTHQNFERWVRSGSPDKLELQSSMQGIAGMIFEFFSYSMFLDSPFYFMVMRPSSLEVIILPSAVCLRT